MHNHPVIGLHALPDPVQHNPHKAVFVKLRDEGLVRLGNVHPLALFLHHVPEQTVGQLEQEALHLVPADAAEGVEYESFVLQHCLKDLLQPLLPGIVGLFPLKRPGGVLHTGPLHQVVNILEMVVEGHPADAAVLRNVPNGNFVQRLLQQHPLQGRLQRLLGGI